MRGLSSFRNARSAQSLTPVDCLIAAAGIDELVDEVGVAMEHRELVTDWLLPVARQETDSAVALFPWNADSGAADGDLTFDTKVSFTREPFATLALAISSVGAWRRHSNTSRY